MDYVEGFVIPMPKKNIAAYRRMATQASKLWRKHGALAFVETVSEKLNAGKDMGVGFKRMAKLKAGEVVVFSWVTYKSAAHQKKVMSALMKDPAFKKICSGPMPFDMKRMAYGGFKMIVKA